MLSCLTIGSNHLKLLHKLDSEVFTANLLNFIASKGMLINFSEFLYYIGLLCFLFLVWHLFQKLRNAKKF